MFAGERAACRARETFSLGGIVARMGLPAAPTRPSPLDALRAAARSLRGTAKDLREGLRRDGFRDALAAELGLMPRAIGTFVPWIVRTRAGADATLLKEVLARAERTPWSLALEMGSERMTWAELADATSRYAHVLAGAGVVRGDTIALIGQSSPAYLAVVLAATRVGATAALVNSRLDGQPLAHAIAAAKARVVVAEPAIAERVRARPEIVARLSRLFTFHDGDLDAAAKLAPTSAFPRVVVPADSDFVYIYTSGTTGLPKPCRVSHAKAVLGGAMMGAAVWEFREGDKLYSVLPLYHSSALLIGFASCVMTGTPFAMRESFSARAFWPDVEAYGATAILYIGELCRYLLNTPEDRSERAHRVRVAVGNGLRADLWEPFQRRFGVPLIREFYGATEAPGAIFNFTGRVGSVGRMPVRRLSPMKLVRFDVERGEHVRDASGLCVECGPGEIGELVITLPESPLTALTEFRGYTDEDATAKKVVRDVVVRGDRGFRSGDLMRFDEDDFFYFVDRIGDTFRFKGENVSTAEVAEVVGRAPGVREVAVAGVKLPGTEGRAGLAAIVCSEFDPTAFWAAMQELPEYAQPRVVRRVDALATTATFKIQKAALDASSIRPDEGEAWVRHEGGYVPITRALWERITRGEVRILDANPHPRPFSPKGRRELSDRSTLPVPAQLPSPPGGEGPGVRVRANSRSAPLSPGGRGAGGEGSRAPSAPDADPEPIGKRAPRFAGAVAALCVRADVAELLARECLLHAVVVGGAGTPVARDADADRLAARRLVVHEHARLIAVALPALEELAVRRWRADRQKQAIGDHDGRLEEVQIAAVRARCAGRRLAAAVGPAASRVRRRLVRLGDAGHPRAAVGGRLAGLSVGAGTDLHASRDRRAVRAADDLAAELLPRVGVPLGAAPRRVGAGRDRARGIGVATGSAERVEAPALGACLDCEAAVLGVSGAGVVAAAALRASRRGGRLAPLRREPARRERGREADRERRENHTSMAHEERTDHPGYRTSPLVPPPRSALDRGDRRAPPDRGVAT